MKFWVTLEGRDTEVAFRAEGKTVWLEMEGRALEADFQRLPDGEVYSLLVGGRSYEVRVTSLGPSLEVTLHGATLPVEVRHPLEKVLQSVRPTAVAGGEETIAAPMPGLVVEIKVKPGEVVAAGQAVAVVEAMKMQNELSTRHAGVVSQVLVAERASVSAGQALVRIRTEAA
jgi:biotin carboxyl carrier protein